MKENEAIEEIKKKICGERPTQHICSDGCMKGNDKCALSVAIKALEEVQQYRAIGTVEEYMKFEDECISEGFTLKSLLEAGEKQKAKRPDYEGDGYSDGHLVYDTWICPCCGKHYEVDYDDYDFCPTCGQCIDWRDEE